MLTCTKWNSVHAVDYVFKSADFAWNQFHWNYNKRKKGACFCSEKNGLSTVTRQVSSKTRSSWKSCELFMLKDSIANEIKIQHLRSFDFSYTVNLYFSDPKFYFRLLRQYLSISTWWYAQWLHLYIEFSLNVFKDQTSTYCRLSKSPTAGG